MLFFSPCFLLSEGSGDAFRALGCSGEIAPSGGGRRAEDGTVVGGQKCLGRVEMLVLCL